VDTTLQERVPAILHDLQWLLQVSPTVSPALARQCVRIAQDRVFDEVQVLSRQSATLRVENRTSRSATPVA
jgi:hypothetical protein